MGVGVGRWHGGRRRWGWLLVTIDVVMVLGIAMVLMAIDAASVKKKKMKKTYLLRRLRIDMQRLAMAAAAVVVNAGGWWPVAACSGHRRCGRSWLQQMAGRRCNGWSGKRCNKRPAGRCCNGWAEGVATNGRGGTGKMQQDVAIFHGGWTTMNDATAIYGSYRKSCNKVPCTLLLTVTTKKHNEFEAYY